MSNFSNNGWYWCTWRLYVAPMKRFLLEIASDGSREPRKLLLDTTDLPAAAQQVLQAVINPTNNFARCSSLTIAIRELPQEVSQVEA